MTHPAAASTYNLTTPMVSQPFSDRALAIRRPSSVSSRSTTTRRHRGHRSHHGGSSYLPQNEFPNFAHTGDVEIIINIDGHEKRYMLHRLILAQCSGFFEASTSEQWSRAQAQGGQIPETGDGRSLSIIGEEGEGSQIGRTRSGSSTQSGPKTMWRYELESGHETQDDDVPMLVQKVNTFHTDSIPTDLTDG